MSERYVARAGLIETDLEHELILLDPETQEMFSLNGTGRWVWQKLPNRSPEEVAGELADCFGVPVEQAHADVQALVAELREAGLLRPDAG